MCLFCYWSYCYVAHTLVQPVHATALLLLFTVSSRRDVFTEKLRVIGTPVWLMMVEIFVMHHVTGNKMDVRSVFWGRLFFTFHPGSQSHPGRHTIAHKWAKTNTSVAQNSRVLQIKILLWLLASSSNEADDDGKVYYESMKTILCSYKIYCYHIVRKYYTKTVRSIAITIIRQRFRTLRWQILIRKL